MYIIDPCVWVNCWMQLPDSYKVATPALCPQCCIIEEMSWWPHHWATARCQLETGGGMEEDGESPLTSTSPATSSVCCFYTSANTNTNSPIEDMFILLQYWSALISIYELKHKYSRWKSCLWVQYFSWKIFTLSFNLFFFLFPWE